jgi:hypothetical protein
MRNPERLRSSHIPHWQQATLEWNQGRTIADGIVAVDYTIIRKVAAENPCVEREESSAFLILT